MVVYVAHMNDNLFHLLINESFEPLKTNEIIFKFFEQKMFINEMRSSKLNDFSHLFHLKK